MDLEDLQCDICEQMFEAIGDRIPRLFPENGCTYCTACVRDMIDRSPGQETFFCPDDEILVARKEKAT